jgi:hypothetical protein
MGNLVSCLIIKNIVIFLMGSYTIIQLNSCIQKVVGGRN